MRIALCLFFCFAFLGVANSQTRNEFDRPWDNETHAIVIDAYHGNSIHWKQLKTDKRVVGILHKSTEGTELTDSKYLRRKIAAKSRGYLWGSYHLLRRGNPIKQAKFYLDTIGKDTANEILAVDVECTDNSQCNVAKYKISAEEIKIFITYIKKETGRYPVFYGNQSAIKDLSVRFPNDSILTKSPLWYARFKTKVSDFPKGIWKSYTFWQFSSEINCRPDKKCLYRAPGTLTDMDINIYYGSTDELRNSWTKFGKSRD